MISEADTKTTESECNRILFVEKRDGVAEAIQFAKRTLHIYRMAVKNNSRGIRSGYGSTYRRSLVLSCLVFRSYIRMMMGNLSGVA